MLNESNLPLGIFPDAEFQAFSCWMNQEDVFAIATDGLTEIAADGEEIGFRGILKTLPQSKGDRSKM
jgi:serine phosphatase RsbU (regulator of sigma subunit)